MAMYNSIFTGGEIDKGVGRSYVPTLLSTPTTSTLTFTLEGNTIDFEIGQQARVADQDEPLGYKFYQLYDITTSGNTKTAHWKEIKDINVVEYLTVVLTSNQTNPNSDLIGATVVIIDTEEQTTLFSTTWKGTALEFEIPTGTVYQVTVGAVSGYATPAAVTHTAGLNKSRTDTFTYNTEVVTVTCTTEDNVAVTGKKVTINGTQYTLDSTGVVSVKIAYGTTYSVSVESWSGYLIPSSQSFTASQASRNVSMEWQTLYADLGLPSGTKWGRINVGASTPYEDGLYFSYGNVDGHVKDTTYTFDNSSYQNTQGAALTTSFQSGSSTYDAARVIMGSPWRLPTKTEIDELVANTTYTKVIIDGFGYGKFLAQNGKFILMRLVSCWQGAQIESSWYGLRLFTPSVTLRDSYNDLPYLLDMTINVSVGISQARYVGMVLRPVR